MRNSLEKKLNMVRALSAGCSCLILCFCFYRGNDAEFDEHFVDDSEEGGFQHGATLDAFVDGDDFVEFLYLLALIEAVEEELNFVFELGRECVSLRARHAGTGAGADRDELFGLGADFFEFFFLLGGIDRALDEGNVELVKYIFGLEDARMANVEHLAPGLEMIVHKFGKNHGAVFAAGEGEPADTEFFVLLFHTGDMVA